MNQQHYIFILLVIEHALSYGFETFRRYEIDEKGVLDINGIPRAPIESWLALLQYFYICFLIGFIVQRLLNIDRHIMPFKVQLATIWILLKMLIMFTTRMYIRLALRMKLSGEVSKNIQTLFMVQKEYFKIEHNKRRIRHDLMHRLNSMVEEAKKKVSASNWTLFKEVKEAESKESESVDQQISANKSFLSNYRIAMDKKKFQTALNRQ